MLMATNPGSVVNLEVTDGNKFQYLFIAFVASIHGFSYCRPVISIDATHLKGKYRGVLFTAVCHDANQQIFPLHLGVGSSSPIEGNLRFLRLPATVRTSGGCNSNSDISCGMVQELM